MASTQFCLSVANGHLWDACEKTFRTTATPRVTVTNLPISPAALASGSPWPATETYNHKRNTKTRKTSGPNTSWGGPPDIVGPLSQRKRKWATVPNSQRGGGRDPDGPPPGAGPRGHCCHSLVPPRGGGTRLRESGPHPCVAGGYAIVCFVNAPMEANACREWGAKSRQKGRYDQQWLPCRVCGRQSFAMNVDQ